MPADRGARQRFVLRAGLWLARRHPAFEAPDSVRVHPEARIHPRGGRMALGERCAVAPGAMVQGSVTMGDDCSIQAYAVLVGYGAGRGDDGEIRIGNRVRIAPHVMIIAANHRFDGDGPIHGQGLVRKSVMIDDDVWLAGRVSVMAGVRIGAGSVVAAGAVVTKDVPPGSVVAGVPARVIRHRGDPS